MEEDGHVQASHDMPLFVNFSDGKRLVVSATIQMMNAQAKTPQKQSTKRKTKAAAPRRAIQSVQLQL